jgi:transitional endoplasmic reticulum ATPase
MTSALPATATLDPASAPGVTLFVHEARPADTDRGLVRIDPDDLQLIGAGTGDIVRIETVVPPGGLDGAEGRVVHARAMPAVAETRGRKLLALDSSLRESLGVTIGDAVTITLDAAAPARRITLSIPDFAMALSPVLLKQINRALELIPVAAGRRVRITLLGGRRLSALVTAVEPAGVVIAGAETDIRLARSDGAASVPTRAQGEVRFEDLGGMSREIARVREMIEWPMRHPDVFSHLGIEAPKGVLLSGPPGTGKTLLAKAVATECQATFFQINGPEIVSKHYGESEEQLRSIFKRAEAKAPAVVFIDEIDAIAPKREGLAGDRQVERRIVAQLLTLLDGMNGRGQVVVMAATNLPSSIDPALRRPGRFDREIAFSVPDRLGRREILDIHTRGMPLGPDVVLDRLAEVTHGYVGADLGALAREAGMSALRRQIGHQGPAVSIDAAELTVSQADFETALNEVGPSAIREVASDVPTVRFTDIGGLDGIKDALTEAVIWPLSYPQYFAEAGLKSTGGVLLHGGPGTGKTLLAKALAHESGVNFIAVRGPQLLSQYVGESEKAVRDVFAKARLLAPAIIFFDEIDSLAPRRGDGGNAAAERVVAQLLTEMDGIEDRRGVFVLAATNRPDRIDIALLRPGRFDRLIEVPLPDASARRSILAVHLARRNLAPDLDLARLAVACDGFSGADIEAACRMAALGPVRRAIALGGRDAVEAITAADFAAALAASTARDSAGSDRSGAPKNEDSA